MSGYAAACWSLGYGLLGLFWAFGGAGFPFGTGDPRRWHGGTLVAGPEQPSGWRLEATLPVVPR